MWQRIEPARVVLDATGAPFNQHYGDVYASRDGALGQARHVFLRGNDLPSRWQGREQFVVVETGFGLGVNFLAAWQAWRDDPARPHKLHFVSVEKHPVDAETLLQFAPAELAALARELVRVWPLPLAGWHRREFDHGAVTLTLAFGDAERVLPQIAAGADAFFLDGFAPERNPDMWSARVLKPLARLAHEGATAATWSTARPVREGLGAAGFEVRLDAGFGHKRQMLRARFVPHWRVRRHAPPAAFSGERRAIVIGAGLAGATAAWALARRGWNVQVLESGPRVASGASALPWGLLHPQITADDNDAARLTRAGFFAAQSMLNELAQVPRQAPLWQPRGTFVQATDAEEAVRWEALAGALALPEGFARFCSVEAARPLLGVAPRYAGWWFPRGASVAAAQLCAALLQQPVVMLKAGATVAQLRRDAHSWIAQDGTGTSIAQASICIVANALDAPRLLQLGQAPLRAVHGRLSLFEAPALGALCAPLSGGGTLLRVDEKTVLVGATYELDANGDESEHAHDGNLQRLSRMLAVPVTAVPVGAFEATRCVARDRLPLVGAVAAENAALQASALPRGAHLADLPRQEGLFASFAFGSRGLALAPLAAELIAAQIEGEPWPMERELAERIDVARFLLEVVRKGGGAGLRLPP